MGYHMGGVEVSRGPNELGVEEEGWGMAAVAAHTCSSVFCTAVHTLEEHFDWT